MSSPTKILLISSDRKRPQDGLNAVGATVFGPSRELVHAGGVSQDRAGRALGVFQWRRSTTPGLSKGLSTQPGRNYERNQ